MRHGSKQNTLEEQLGTHARSPHSLYLCVAGLDINPKTPDVRKEPGERKVYVPPHARGPSGSSAEPLQDAPSSQASSSADYASWSSAPTQQHSGASYSAPSHQQRFGGHGTRSSRYQPSDRFHTTPLPRDSYKETQLFGSKMNTGINFGKYDEIPVEVSGNNVPVPIKNVCLSMSFCFFSLVCFSLQKATSFLC